MKLLGVTVNYKTPELTLQSARGLAKALEQVPDSRFVIVDNDSQDGSYEFLRDAVAREPFADRCEVLASPRNGGFGYGNNFAIRRNLASADRAEYIYLLNSDAVPSENAVKVLVDFMDAHKRAGMAGSYIHGPEGEPHETAFRFPSFFSEFEEQAQTGPISKLLSHHLVALPMPEQTVEVEWTAAVSLLMRTEMLERIGLFDEEFFLYYEETDLCRRARNVGYSVHYVRESEVSHIGSVSTGMKQEEKPMPTFWFESRLRYFKKHHGLPYSMLANVAWLGGRSLRGVRRLVERRPDQRRPRVTRDFIRYNFSPNALRD